MQSGIEVPLPTNDNRIGLMMTTRCHGEKFSLYANRQLAFQARLILET
jgi:hypothetical protein